MLERLKKKWEDFMNNEELKHKIYMIIYDTDTPLGKLFDVFLICFILLSVVIVILESVFPPSFKILYTYTKMFKNIIQNIISN